MKTRIYGALCCVTFLLTVATYLSFIEPIGSSKNTTSRPVYHKSFEQGQTLSWLWSWREETAPATSLVIVGWEGCPPCQRMKKEVIPVLLKQGYNVRYYLTKNWKGPKVKIAPTLFYLDANRKIVLIETKFQTVAHIKKYLIKWKA